MCVALIAGGVLDVWLCLQERESTCARREMEQLRLEYMAREERFHLDGDRNELRSIKQELDELRYASFVPPFLFVGIFDSFCPLEDG